MSGICGILHLDGQPVKAETLEKMMDALAHRGIDGSGAWREGAIALGHQMLHLTPESLTEKLPFSDPPARLAITADNRMDNRMELFRQLEIPHSRQAGTTDSGLILEAYKNGGKECPDISWGILSWSSGPVWIMGFFSTWCNNLCQTS